MTTTEADRASEQARELVSAVSRASKDYARHQVMADATEYAGKELEAERALLTYIASLERENERLEDQRDEHCRREVEYGDALRRIVNLEIPLGVGAECADWFKGIARQALDSEEG